MADNSIRIDIDVEIAQARKQVADLTKELNQQNSSLKKLQSQYDALRRVQNEDKAERSIEKYNTMLQKANERIKALSQATGDFAVQKFGDNATRVLKMYSAEQQKSWGKRTASLAKGQRSQLGISEDDYKTLSSYMNSLGQVQKAERQLQQQRNIAIEQLSSETDESNKISDSISLQKKKVESTEYALSRLQSIYKEAFANSKALNDELSAALEGKDFYKDVADSSKVSDKNMFNLYEQLRELEAEKAKLEKSFGGKPVGTEEYDEVISKIQVAKDNIKDYQKVQKELQDDVSKGSYFEDLKNQTTVANQKIFDLVNALDDLKARRDDLEKSYGTKPFGVKEYDETIAKIKTIEGELKNYQKDLATTKQAEIDLAKGATDVPKEETLFDWLAGDKSKSQTALSSLNQRVSSDLGTLKSLFGEFGSYAKSKMSGLGSALVSTAAATGKGTLNALKFIGSGLKTIFGTFAKYALNFIPNMTKAITAPFKGLEKRFSGFGKRLKTAILQGLIFRPVRTSLTNILKMYSELMMANVEVSNSFGQVKGAAITAFQPFLTAIVPIIKTVCNWIVMLIQFISQLLSMFFKIGAGSKSAAKGLYNQSKATGAASKANEKFLASWDTIQQVQQKSSGGGGSGSEITPQFDFKDVDFNLDWLKKKIDAGDWYGIGMELSKKLNDLLKIVDNWLTASFEPKAIQVAKNAADFLNGIVDGIDPAVLGKTIADFLNTCILSAFVFLSTFNFSSAGEKLAQILNNIVSNVNWEYLGKAISLGITGAFDFVIGFISKFDWSKLGKSVATSISNINWGQIGLDIIKLFVESLKGFANFVSSFFENLDYSKIKTSITNMFNKLATEIDWGQFASAVVEAIGAALGAAIRLIWENFIQPAWDAVVGWWRDNAIKDGHFTIDGLFQGISEALKDLYNWIKKNIFDPFVKGFKAAFGIASPSTVMAELGGYISQGLLNGISDKLSGISDWIKTHIFDPIKGGIDTLFGINQGESSKMKSAGSAIINGLKNGMDSGLAGIKSVLNAIISAVESAVNWIITKLNTLNWTIPDWVPGLGGKSFGFNISPITIPRLAQGTVVNPGHQFQAILGDNRQEQEVVSPLSTMKQAFVEALQESGYNKNGNVTLQIDGQTFARITNPYLQKETSRIGIKATGGIA